MEHARLGGHVRAARPRAERDARGREHRHGGDAGAALHARARMARAPARASRDISDLRARAFARGVGARRHSRRTRNQTTTTRATRPEGNGLRTAPVPLDQHHPGQQARTRRLPQAAPPWPAAHGASSPRGPEPRRRAGRTSMQIVAELGPLAGALGLAAARSNHDPPFRRLRAISSGPGLRLDMPSAAATHTDCVTRRPRVTRG